MLPSVKKVKLQDNVFPTVWQAVLFRNYGYAAPSALAVVLSCDEETVAREAARLGLPPFPYDKNWTEKGYITVIRNNWYLLPYEQIAELLECDEERLAFILKEEDFLSVKLGRCKPECARVSYAPLDREQEEKTRALAAEIAPLLQEKGSYFRFFTKEPKSPPCLRDEKTRIVHGYLTPCGNCFASPSEEYLSDNLLGEYAAKGVNGLWMHGVLSALSPYPFKPSLSARYLENRRILKELIVRAARFGIKIYLYFNEPRSLDIASFAGREELAGQRDGDLAALCSSRKETKRYLYNAVKDLVSDVGGLGGIITITMSEYLTHCNSQLVRNCPRCKDIPAEELAAEMNNIIAAAVKDSGADIEVIANLWGWSALMGWTEEQALRGVDLLDKEISVMCVSEYGLPIEKGGVKTELTEYSVADIGPSRLAQISLERARLGGHKIYAKIQVNNSWECSAVPYLPIFDLVYEHLKNLEKIGVYDYMLSWTLGGYPSVNLDLVRDFSEKGGDFSLSEWYEKTFGKEGARVREAVRHFCAAFKHYPISLGSLYHAPKNIGAANLWSLSPEEKTSAMVGFSFDDYEMWTLPYPYETYIALLDELLRGWEKGLALLEEVRQEEAERLARYARAAYLHFKADRLQTEFSHCKRDIAGNREKIAMLIDEERSAVLELLRLQRGDAYIGFEASNHYFYTDRNLAEKYLQLNEMQKTLEKRR